MSYVRCAKCNWNRVTITENGKMADTADKEMACEENKGKKENREIHETNTPTISDSFMVSMKLSSALADRKSTRLNSSHITRSRMPSSA